MKKIKVTRDMREFLRALRSDALMWALLIVAIALQAWFAVGVIGVCAMVTATLRQWNLVAYRRMLDSYGMMVEGQQHTIARYQAQENGSGMHPSEEHARRRLN